MKTSFRVPLLCLALIGCTAPTHWREFEQEAPFEDVWTGFVRIAERHGFYEDFSRTDRGERIWVSRWREKPAPFRRGYRDRLHGEFTRPEREDGTIDGSAWKLRFHVERQVVDDMSKGFDPEEDDWSAAGQDRDREDYILGQLRMTFGSELGIQPTYRR